MLLPILKKLGIVRESTLTVIFSHQREDMRLNQEHVLHHSTCKKNFKQSHIASSKCLGEAEYDCDCKYYELEYLFLIWSCLS